MDDADADWVRRCRAVEIEGARWECCEVSNSADDARFGTNRGQIFIPWVVDPSVKDQR